MVGEGGGSGPGGAFLSLENVRWRTRMRKKGSVPVLVGTFDYGLMVVCSTQRLYKITCDIFSAGILWKR